jgi:uncharacterized protein YceK
MTSMRGCCSTVDDAHSRPGVGCIIISRSMYRAVCVRSVGCGRVLKRERESEEESHPVFYEDTFQAIVMQVKHSWRDSMILRDCIFGRQW